MSNGLTPQKNKQVLTIEKDQKAHNRSENFKDFVQKIIKYGILVALMIAIIWYVIIMHHTLKINDWDTFNDAGKQFGAVVLGYFIGLINKKFTDI